MATHTFKLNSSVYTVEVEPKKSITVTRNNYAPTKFEIGDWAEYDSYNLHYDGIIRNITDKTVTIEAYPNSTLSKKYRLKLENFAWRNYDFNKSKNDARNHETMMYI